MDHVRAAREDGRVSSETFLLSTRLPKMKSPQTEEGIQLDKNNNKYLLHCSTEVNDSENG